MTNDLPTTTGGELMTKSDDTDYGEAYKRIYVDKKGPPKEWLEKHYKGHGIYGYGNTLIAKAYLE